tara:strand:+ start:12958 stop:13671 length:714 start_codon:yes stop_codon:yes gene_type:complete
VQAVTSHTVTITVGAVLSAARKIVVDKAKLKEILDSHKLWRQTGAGRRANLRGANLRGANLRDANLRSADLCGADLRSADLRYADLRNANLCGANLLGADLCGANLSGADLSGTNLRYANLRYANLRDANLRSANLRSADLCGADLRSADLRYADLRNANLWSVVGNMTKVHSMQLQEYSITFTTEVLQIGCQRHAIEEWRSFSDDYISDMDSMALKFWTKYKDFIFQAIELAKEPV